MKGKISLVMSLALSISSCASSDIQLKVTSYNDAVRKTSAVLNNFYDNLNVFAKTSYISDLRLHPEKKMYTHAFRDDFASDTASNHNDRKSYLTGVPYRFSPDGIQVRLLVISALANYSQGLVALANSDAPTKTASEIEALGNNIEELSKTALALKKNNDDADEIAAIGGPLTKFTALIGELWIAHRGQEFLKDSVLATEKISNQLFDLLEEDVTAFSNGFYANEYNTMLGHYIDEYNRSYVGKGTNHTDAERGKFLNEIANITDMQSSLQATDPLLLIRDMRQVHDELVLSLQSAASSVEDELAKLADLTDSIVDALQVVDTVDQLLVLAAGLSKF